MFIQFLLISIISLVITYILFSKLKASAEGKGTVWGNSMTFGGSLAGFVIVFTLLFQAYSQLVDASTAESSTEISIDGNWQLHIEAKSGETESGYATIQQAPGSAKFEVYAQLRDVNGDLITFSSEIGELRSHHAIYVYQTNKGEIGLALGDIPKNNPDSFSMAYYDVANTDKNNNDEGTISFIRIQDTAKWQQVLNAILGN